MVMFSRDLPYSSDPCSTVSTLQLPLASEKQGHVASLRRKVPRMEHDEASATATEFALPGLLGEAT